jgi:hypothetical protein
MYAKLHDDVRPAGIIAHIPTRNHCTQAKRPVILRIVCTYSARSCAGERTNELLDCTSTLKTPPAAPPPPPNSHTCMSSRRQSSQPAPVQSLLPRERCGNRGFRTLRPLESRTHAAWEMQPEPQITSPLGRANAASNAARSAIKVHQAMKTRSRGRRTDFEAQLGVLGEGRDHKAFQHHAAARIRHLRAQHARSSEENH